MDMKSSFSKIMYFKEKNELETQKFVKWLNLEVNFTISWEKSTLSVKAIQWSNLPGWREVKTLSWELKSVFSVSEQWSNITSSR